LRWVTKLERRNLTYRDVVVKLEIKLANFRWVAEVKRRKEVLLS
jgi:hypothetical protein